MTDRNDNILKPLRLAVPNRILYSFLLVSALLYLAAMVTPPFRVGAPNPHPWADGWQELLTGWMGLFLGITAWLANPLLFATWVLAIYRRRLLAIAAAACGLVFALTFLSQSMIPVNEGGEMQPVHLDAPGYWLWIASLATAAVACLFIKPRVAVQAHANM